MGIIIRQSLKGTIVNYIGAFIGFIVQMFISTKFLKPEELGLTRIIIEISTVVGGLMAMGAGSSGMRFFPFFKTDKNNHNNGFLFYLLVFPVIGTLIFGILYVALKSGITTYYQTESPLFNRFFYYVIPLSIYIAFTSVFETYATNLMRIVIPKIIREILLRLMNICVIMLYFWGYFTLSQFVLATVSIYGIMLILNALYIATLGKFSLKHDFSYIDKPLRKNVMSYTGFFMLASLGGALVSKIDMFMVGGLQGLDEVAIYSTAFYMAAIIEIPTRSLQSISAPEAAQAMKENDRQKALALFQKLSLNQLLIGAMIFVFLWINIDNIYHYMPRSEVYSLGKFAVLFLAIANLFSMTSGFAGTILSYSKFYYYSLFFTFFLTFLTFGLNLYFIPRYGVSGAAFATMSTFVLYNVAMLTFVKWKLNLHPFSGNMLKIVAITGGLFFVNYFVLPTLSNPLIDSILRSSILAVAAGLSVYFWNVSNDMNALVKSIIHRKKISSL